MTKSEEIDDPFSAHLKRDPLPGAGIRIILLTRLPHDRAVPSSPRWKKGSPSWNGRSSNESLTVDGVWPRRRASPRPRGCHMPLVLVTTAIEPWTTNHLDPLLKAIDQSDHVIGRRPRPARSGGTTWLRAAGQAIDLCCSSGRRPLAVPAASARKARGHRASVAVVVPRHRNPGEGDISRTSDR